MKADARHSKAVLYPALGDSPADRDTLIRFLDAEITRTAEEQRQPGWSKWALTGALATVGWLFLAEWETRIFDAAILGALIVSIAFAYDALTGLALVLGAHQGASEHLDRTLSLKEVLGRRRLSFLLGILRVGIVTYLAATVALPVYGWSRAIAVSMAGLTLCFMVVTFMMTFVDVAIPRMLQVKASGVVFFGSQIIVYAVVSASFFLPLRDIPPDILVPHIRLAVLMAAVWYLLTALLFTERHAPLLSALTRTRQKLELGQLDCEGAARQIDIALAGLRLADALQVHLDRFLKLVEEYGERVRRQSTLQASAIQMLTAVDETTTEQELIVVEAILSSMNDENAKLGTLISKQLSQALMTLEVRLSLVNGLGSKEALAEVRSVIETAFAEMKSTAARYDAESRKFQTVAKESLNAKRSALAVSTHSRQTNQ